MKQDNLPTVCVVGLGYIGLPTAAVIARAGCPVLGNTRSESLPWVLSGRGQTWRRHSSGACQKQRRDDSRPSHCLEQRVGADRFAQMPVCSSRSAGFDVFAQRIGGEQ